jgi:HAD superfamily hydrolase (TIGR01484 family)
MATLNHGDKTTIQPLTNLPSQVAANIDIVLTDIDDTLTTEGKLTSEAYIALEQLQNSGLKVIPVTGRCAGWCDHIARMWPVSGVVGENGAFYFRYDHTTKTMHRQFAQSDEVRLQNYNQLHAIGTDILSKVAGTALASDQEYRLTDLAIDFAEDVPELPMSDIRKIVTIAEQSGLTAKISSIHVNCWIGDHSKLTTSLKMLDQEFGIPNAALQERVVFAGDSPNDATMFGYFNNSVGVANVLDSLSNLTDLPTYITKNKGGAGFSELANILLAAHQSN